MDPRPNFPEAWNVNNKINPHQVVDEMLREELQDEFSEMEPTGGCLICGEDVDDGVKLCRGCLEQIRSDYYEETFEEVLEIEWDLVQANLL